MDVKIKHPLSRNMPSKGGKLKYIAELGEFYLLKVSYWYKDECDSIGIKKSMLLYPKDWDKNVVFSLWDVKCMKYFLTESGFMWNLLHNNWEYDI